MFVFRNLKANAAVLSNLKQVLAPIQGSYVFASTSHRGCSYRGIRSILSADVMKCWRKCEEDHGDHVVTMWKEAQWPI